MRNVPVPMRDGVRLATSVYLPAAEGAYPTVLVRTAYNRRLMARADFAQVGLAAAAQGLPFALGQVQELAVGRRGDEAVDPLSG